MEETLLDTESKKNKNTREKDEWTRAAAKASACRHFRPDDEEKRVADDAVSCFNCRYRRWAVEAAFTCLKRSSS
jgi:hypothetical protein